MDRKITIQIGDRKYNLTARNDEQERLYRLAADAINGRIQSFARSNPGRTMLELMTLAALNESVCRFDLQHDMDSLRAESAKLSGDLDAYLDSVGK